MTNPASDQSGGGAKAPLCQSVMQNDATASVFHEAPECGRPAKAWIPDDFKRIGWNGRQYLCGLHAAAHDRVAKRLQRPLANRIL